MFVVFFIGSLLALHSRYSMMARWKVEYLKAILRQDVGWYDVNQPQQLAAHMSEAMQNIDQAFTVATYQGYQMLGMCIVGSIVALVVVPGLAGVCLGCALVLVLPASLLLTHTVENRTRELSRAYGQAGGYVAEVLGAIRTVASLGSEGRALAKYDESLLLAEKVRRR